MLKQHLLIILQLICFGSMAQKTTISGQAAAYPHQELSVWTNLDYISEAQKELAFTEIDSLGNFELEFTPPSIQYITLKIGKNIASLYAEPGAKYEVKLGPPDSLTYQNPFLEHDVKLDIKLKSKTEINALTIDFEKRFDDFLGVEYKSFVRRTPREKIDSFRLAMTEFYSTVKNPFFQQYIQYAISTMEEETKTDNKKLYKNYLQHKPVLYEHPEYMNFFNAFYKQNVQNFALSKNGYPLFFQINDRGSFSGTMEVLKREPFLENDTLAELVLLKGLKESYYDGTFKKPSIIALLQQIEKESKVPQHRTIAFNILSTLSRLQKGTLAPGFELPDKTGHTHNLDEIREKKMVYLMFFDKNCEACLQQMKVIPALKKLYGERIEFVSVSSDQSNEELSKFLTANPKFDWLFLYDNTGEKLKSDYEIRSLPAYYLIDSNGKFIRVPADGPDGDIEQVFYDLTKIKSKLHNVGSKQN